MSLWRVKFLSDRRVSQSFNSVRNRLNTYSIQYAFAHEDVSDQFAIYANDVIDEFLKKVDEWSEIYNSTRVQTLEHEAVYADVLALVSRFPDVSFLIYERLLEKCELIKKARSFKCHELFQKNYSLASNPSHTFTALGLEIDDPSSQYLPNVSFLALADLLVQDSKDPDHQYGKRLSFGKIWLATATERINRYRIMPCQRFFFSLVMVCYSSYNPEFLLNSSFLHLYTAWLNFDRKWPYVELPDKILYSPESRCSVQMPIIAGVLMQNFLHKHLGNIRALDEVNIFHLDLALTGLDGTHMAFKELEDDLVFLMGAYANDFFPLYGQVGHKMERASLMGCFKRESNDVGVRHIAERYKKTRIKWENRFPYVLNYFDQMLTQARSGLVKDILPNLIELQHFFNPGNFIAAYTEIFMRESAEMRTRVGTTGLGKPTAFMIWEGKSYPVRFELKGLYADLSRIFKENYIPKLQQAMSSKDFEVEYFNALTSKSGADQVANELPLEMYDTIREVLKSFGLDVDSQEPLYILADEHERIRLENIVKRARKLDKSNIMTPKAVADLIMKKRIGGFTVVEQFYYRPETFAKFLTLSGKLGERIQSHRRVRIIYVVSNAVQVGTLPMKILGEEMAKIESSLAGGKNEGNIADMAKLLVSTSQPDYASLSADIKGADTSTTQEKNFLVVTAAEDAFNQCFKKYFCFSGDISLTENLTPVYQSILVCVSTMYNTIFKSEKRQLGLRALIAHTFPTGTFMTTTQHNLLYLLALKKCDEMVKILCANPSMDAIRKIFQGWCENLGAIIKEGKIMRALEIQNLHPARLDLCFDDILKSILGDDLFISLHASESKLPWLSKLYEHVMELIFSELGYKLEPFTSLHQGVFLQMSAWMGIVVPKPARISLYFAEKSEGKWRFPVDHYVEFRSLANELATRSKFPEAMLIVKKVIWSHLRVFSVPLRIIPELPRVFSPYVSFVSSKEDFSLVKTLALMRADLFKSVLCAYSTMEQGDSHWYNRPPPFTRALSQGLNLKLVDSNAYLMLPFELFSHPRACQDTFIPYFKSPLESASFWAVPGSFYYFAIFQWMRYIKGYQGPMTSPLILKWHLPLLVTEYWADFQPNEVRESMISSPVMSTVFSSMATKMRKYLPKEKMRNSALAIAELETHGIDVPFGMTVLGQLHKKLHDIIIGGPEAFLEKDLKMLAMKNFLKGISRYTPSSKYFRLVQYQFTFFRETLIKPSFEAASSAALSLSFAIDDSPTHRTLLNWFGLPLKGHKHPFKQNIIHGAPSTDTLLQEIHSRRMTAEQRRLFLLAVGVPESDHMKVDQMLMAGLVPSKFPFFHIVESKKYFYLDIHTPFNPSNLSAQVPSKVQIYAVDLFKQLITAYPSLSQFVGVISSIGSDETLQTESQVARLQGLE